VIAMPFIRCRYMNFMRRVWIGMPSNSTQKPTTAE
jgi:hypothetical protein